MSSKKMKIVLKSILSIILCLAIFLTSLSIPEKAHAASGSWTGGTVQKGYHLKISYTETEQNPVTNTSRVTATLYLVQDKAYDLYISTRSATITINGVKTTISNIPAIRNKGNITTVLGSASTVVAHNANGAQSIAIAGTFDMNATLAKKYYGTMSTSNTVALDNLDRVAPTVSLSYGSVTTNSVSLTAVANTTCDSWQYSLNSGASWASFGAVGTANTLTISNLSGGTAYPIMVRARKTTNLITSAPSNVVSAITKPNPPGGLQVSGVTQTSAQFGWNTVSGATAYKLFINGNLKAGGVQAKSYQYSDLIANSSYQFGVAATGASGDSSISSTANYITLPNAPTGLTLGSQTDHSVSLNWSQSNGGNAAVTTFNIYRDGSLIGTSSTPAYVDTTYKNTNSNYSVCAVTSAGASANSAAVSVQMIPLSISLGTLNQSTYTTIRPTFIGGSNCEIDLSSLKWAYGEQNAEYFVNQGNSFTGSFAAVQNGTYTVYVKDSSGNASVSTATVSGIYTKAVAGAYVLSNTDLTVNGVGAPISFERTYNSMDQTMGVFGKGWSLNYAKSTYLSDNGAVQVVCLPDGTVNYFKVNQGSYTGIKTQNTLVANGTQLLLTTKNNIKYTYENHYLTQIEDANGNITQIQLNAENLPIKIIDCSGRTYEIQYTEDHRISSITDPAQRSISYLYDANGNLVEQKQASNRTAYQYSYENGVLVKVKNLIDNQETTITYNNQNQVIQLNSGGEKKYYVYKITSNGETVIYESPDSIAINEMASEKNPPNNTYNPYNEIVVDSDGLLYEYNADGTRSKVDGVNTDRTIIQYSYDEKGNVTKIVTADKSEKVISDVSYKYSYFSGTAMISSAEEIALSNTYDGLGALTNTKTTTTTTTWDLYGNQLCQRVVGESGDQITSNTYGAKGKMLSETAKGKSTAYSYDLYGNVTKITVTDQKTNEIKSDVAYTYNIVGQVRTQTDNGLTVTTVYDVLGNRIKVTETDGATTRVKREMYDGNNQITQRIDPKQYRASDDLLEPNQEGICTTNRYANSNIGERYTYDSNHNVLTYINSAGNYTVNVYDLKNKLVKTTLFVNQNSTGDGLVTRYLYDEKGNLIQTVYPHQYQANQDGLDVANGINVYRDSNVGERATYDEKGNIIHHIDSFNQETTDIYDANNHLVKSVTGSEVTRYVYGGGEHLLQVIYPNQYLASDDRLDLTTTSPVDTYANANVGDRYTYTTDGKVLTYTNQYGLITTNHYDEGGTLTAVTKSDGTEFQFQSDGKATKEVYGNGLTNQITNDKLQTTVSGSNGMITTWKQDAFGKVMEYQVQNGDVTKRYAYTYDDEGNILTISLNGTLQQTFTYDQFSELSRVDDAVANQSTTYTYDASGNITGIQTYAYTTGVLSTPISTLNYTYDAKNMRTDLSYDANGNLTSLNGADFTWSTRDLTGVTKGADHYFYTYNHAGIRTSKNVNGITTTYKVNEKNQVVEQSDGTNSIKFAYDSQDQPVYMEYQGKTYYYEKNLEGDIIGLFDDGKNSVVQYQYDSWGKLLNTTGTLASTVGTINPLRYRGYYYDVETGFYYLQSRYYDPESCRFLSADDPAFSQAETKASANLHSYCNNNCVNRIDPDGYAAKKTYSGIVGFGIQICLVGNLACYQGYLGVEALWFAFTGNNNFGNGLIPWCYAFGGFSGGLTLDFSKLLSPNLLNNPKNVLQGFGFNLSISLSVSLFVIYAKNLKSPYDYAGAFSFAASTVWGVTVSKAWGGRISTYGIGWTWQIGISKRSCSIGSKLFGGFCGASYYWMIPVGPNSRALYNIAKNAKR